MTSIKLPVPGCDILINRKLLGRNRLQLYLCLNNNDLVDGAKNSLSSYNTPCRIPKAEIRFLAEDGYDPNAFS
jgi:hypothetical protein